MKRNLLLALSGLVLLALGIGCRHHEPNPVSTENLPSAPVTVHRLEARETELIEETVGTVRSKRHARIEAKVSGRVLEVLVVVGQTVRAGEVLVRLEVSETRARLEQARAVDEQARSDFRRLASLLERQAATPAEFESIQARARAAAAAVKELESLAGNGEIAAPFDAVVTSKSVETGDLAMPGKPLIELEDPQTMRLEVQVGESLIRHLQPGLALPVRAPSWDGPVQGVVSEISPAADPASRTLLVKLELPSTPRLRSGAFARVDLPGGRAKSLRVPSVAVIQRGQLELVFVAAEGHARLRLVKSGRVSGAETELLAGVSAGESVIVEGASGLRDGQPITVQP
jgi:RND family efflux transporter MFP subunit